MSFPRRALLALAISMAVPVCAAQAATFNIPSGDVAALKSAISVANASAQNDVINLTAGTYTLETAQETSSGPTALPPIQAGSGTLTINGNSALVTRGTAQGAPFCRALKVETGAIVVVKDLKIRQFKNFDPGANYPGETARQGGAIENLGILTLSNSDVSSNESLSGGAVSNEGTLTVNQGVYNFSRARRGGAFKNSGTATFNGVVCNSNAAGAGGGIENTGTLTVNDGFIQNNEAANGGALQNNGTATLKRANIVRNRSFYSGTLNNEGTLTLLESVVTGSNAGGITNRQNLFVRQSLILGNAGSGGAGIYTTGTLEASNSTFASNVTSAISGSPDVAGGAITVDVSGNASLDSCTIADNGALVAIAVKGGSLTLRNSIVARNGSVDANGNRTSGDIAVSGGSFSSGGNNLIGRPGAVTGFVASDQVGTNAAPLDPRLGELRDNGGATNTFSLLAGSPALDKGNTALAIDQRGLPRPAGSADDIGAFEAQSAPIPSGALVVTTLADIEDASDGLLSLREAITRANANDGPDTIRFADNVRGAIALTKFLPAISNQLTIEGPGASLLALDGGNKTTILAANSRETTAINGLTFRNGNGDFDGGTGVPGGAIGTADSGLLQVRNCAFLNNRSYNAGAINSGGNLLIEGCIFSGNSAINGGALYVSGSGAIIRNSTFNGNSVVQGRFDGAGAGSGIYVSSSSVSIDSCTITDNTIVGNVPSFNVSGGGISASNAAGTVEIRNSILSGNANGDVVIAAGTNNPFVSKGNNIVGAGNAASKFSLASDQIGVDPKLAPLADNGGPTQTRALLAGSPALDKGQTTLTTDQRGVSRPQGAAADIGAYESEIVTPPTETPSLIVTTLSDVAANDGLTSLREAIAYSDAKAGADTITFADNLRGTSVLNGTQLPVVTGELTISGPGSSRITLDADFKSRVLQVSSAGKLTLSGLTLTRAEGGAIHNAGALLIRQVNFSNNGINVSEGGAIYNSGDLDVQDSIFSSNRALGNGGAIYNSGTLAVLRSTFSRNGSSGAGQGGGGAIYNGGTANLIDSTLNNNATGGGFSGSSSSSNSSGGGVLSRGTLNLRGCTFSGNSIVTVTADVRGTFCGGAICISAGTFTIESCTITDNFADEGKGSGLAINGTGTIHNTIIAGNRGSDVDGDGAFTSSGYNLIGRGTAAARFSRGSDQIGVTDAKLGPLASNGGSTQTHEPLAGSPAIDRGQTPLATDQRGFPRPVGRADDIGALETQAATPPPSEKPSLIVTTNLDVVADDGLTSLREAMLYANTKTGADTIGFARRVRGVITLNSPLPAITDDLMINGPGAPLLAIDGGGQTRLFRINAGANVEISYLTLSGARFDSNGGEGAIYNAGTLTLRQLAIINNVGAEGGAVCNVGGALQIVGCQISGNRATKRGGALLNNNGTITVLNSTLSNNLAAGKTAASGGGAVASFGSDAILTLEYVTMTGNRAPNIAGNTRAGVWMQSGLFVPHSSIFWGNGNCDLQVDGGTISSAGYSIFGKTENQTGLASTDQFGVDPLLGALANNGGPTQTQALWPGSPAINAGDPNIGNGSDQRGLGFPRKRGGRIDIGAYESQSDPNSSAKSAQAPSAPSAVAAPATSGGSS